MVDERPARSAPFVAVEVRVRGAGPAGERPGESGSAHFLEHLVFKGTADQKAGEIDATIEGMGGELSAYTLRDYTRYSLVVPAASWREALALLAGALLRPALRPADIEAERAVILSEAAVAEGDSHRTGLRAVCSVAFPEADSYRSPLLGEAAAIRLVSADQLRAYHGRLYRAENLTIAVSGPLTGDEVQAAVETLFPADDAQAGAPPTPRAVAPEPPATVARANAAAVGASLPTVHVAFHAPAPSSPEAAAVEVLAALLSRGGASSNGFLGDQVVTRGKALAAAAEYLPLRRGGLLVLSATGAEGASPADLEAALLGALDVLKEDGVSAGALAGAKGAVAGQSLYDAQTPEGWARRLADADALGVPPERMKDHLAAIRSVTTDDVLAAARAVLRPARRAVAAPQTGGAL